MIKKSTTNTFRPARKPHNARKTDYGSLDELLAVMGAEPRKARVGKREVTMPRIERLLRVIVARAADGNVRELTQLFRIMAKQPSLAATFREEIVTVFSGALARL